MPMTHACEDLREPQSPRTPLGLEAEADLRAAGYRVTSRLARGATSDVFEVETRAGVRCAAKVLRPGHFDPRPRAEARFDREARALAAVSHPNLVPLLDAGTTRGGLRYLVMPRLVGESLRSRLSRRGPLHWTKASRLLAGALEGLDEAHRAGIVHRDVKPTNLFLAEGAGPGELGRRVRAVVLDFGIAKVARGRAAAAERPGERTLVDGGTTPGFVLGTPRYLAPEQILDGAIDGRADVYAAGIVLFEAIAGSGPFDDPLAGAGDPLGARARGERAPVDPLEDLERHLSRPPRRLADAAPVPLELEAIAARALEKAPGRRFSSAGAMAVALRRALFTRRPLLTDEPTLTP